MAHRLSISNNHESEEVYDTILGALILSLRNRWRLSSVVETSVAFLSFIPSGDCDVLLRASFVVLEFASSHSSYRLETLVTLLSILIAVHYRTR